MKKCPFCAEWIQDEAVKCRYCLTNLPGTSGADPSAQQTSEQPGAQVAPAAEPVAGARPGEGAMKFSHSGYRYVLGYVPDFCGVWERDRPGGPVERFPRNDQGWADAWTRFRALEPQAVEVAAQGRPALAESEAPAAAVPGPAMGAGDPPQGAPAAPSMDSRIGEGALRFSHSGVRYILGYGQGFFGIWDRQTPGGPILQFPRNDQGWAEAWNRFTAWEPRAVEVPQGTPAPDVRASFKGNYRSGHTLAMWVVALISLSMVVGLIGILLWAGHLADIRGFQNGTTPLQHVQDSENTALGMDGIIIWVILIAGILWLFWQHRAHRNLRALGVGELKYTPGWAVGWWLIPFANVVMPFLTMRELWKANDPEAGSIDWVARRATPILGLWWAGRLVTQILFQIGIAFDNNLKSIADLKAESWLFIAGNISLIVWGVLAILLVRSIDSRQEQKHQRMVAWTRSFPQPA